MQPSRLRIACDPTAVDRGIINDLPQGSASWWRGCALRVEFALVLGGIAMGDAGNLSSVSCRVKASQTETATLMSKTIFSGDINNLVTLDAWKAGTGQQGVIAFDADETALPLGGKARKSFWMVLVATLEDDSVITLAAGQVTCREPNAEAMDPPPDYPAPIILPGPQGQPGADGNSLPIPLVAAVALGSNTFVHIKSDGTAERADASTGKAAHGFTPSAVLQGNAFPAYRVGAYNGFSGLTPSALYWLGTNGQPTSDPPNGSSSISQLIGVGVAAGTLSVDIHPEIIL